MERATGDEQKTNQPGIGAPKVFFRHSIYGKWISENPLVFLVLTFIVSRSMAYASGVFFDIGFFVWGPQGLDTWLLKNKLWESIWYMHGQPPLFNLFNALVLNNFPPTTTKYIFQFCWLGLGLLHTVLLYKVLQELSLSRKVSLLITLYFALSPAAILYENLYYYTQIELFVLTLSAWLLVKLLKLKSFKFSFLFFLSLAVLILTRSMFHWFWLLGIILLLLLMIPGKRKILLLACIFPVLLSGSWYLKNYMLFGKFAASTWLGVSLANVVEPETGISQIERWKSIDYYNDFLTQDNRYKNIELLHVPYRRDSLKNLNHLQYIHVSDLFMQESVNKIKQEPLGYLQNVLKAHFLFFSAASNYQGLGNIRDFIKEYVSLYDLSFLNALYKRYTGKILYYPAIYISIAYIIILTLAIWRIFKLMKSYGNNRNTIVLMLFLLYNIFYIDIVGNFFEYSENVRFRFITIPSMLVLTAILAENYLPLLKRLIFSLKPQKRRIPQIN